MDPSWVWVSWWKLDLIILHDPSATAPKFQASFVRQISEERERARSARSSLRPPTEATVEDWDDFWWRATSDILWWFYIWILDMEKDIEKHCLICKSFYDILSKISFCWCLSHLYKSKTGSIANCWSPEWIWCWRNCDGYIATCIQFLTSLPSNIEDDDWLSLNK